MKPRKSKYSTNGRGAAPTWTVGSSALSPAAAATRRWASFRDLEGLVCDLKRAGDIATLCLDHEHEATGSGLIRYAVEDLAAKVAEFKKQYYQAYKDEHGATD